MRRHEGRKSLQNAHRTQGIGHHHAHELLRRDLGNRLCGIVGDSRVDEEEIEASARQA